MRTTPLHEAATKGMVNVAELLLDRGAYIDAKDRVKNLKKNRYPLPRYFEYFLKLYAFLPITINNIQHLI
jgi:ankyrin repeat protein